MSDSERVTLTSANMAVLVLRLWQSIFDLFPFSVLYSIRFSIDKPLGCVESAGPLFIDRAQANDVIVFFSSEPFLLPLFPHSWRPSWGNQYSYFVCFSFLIFLRHNYYNEKYTKLVNLFLIIDYLLFYIVYHPHFLFIMNF